MIAAAADLVATLASRLPENSFLWSYTITGDDRTAYLTRTLLPRLFGQRPLIHQIHRPDRDPNLHNHPWENATFLVVSGGYVEARLDDELAAPEVRAYGPGDVNRLTSHTFHRIDHVLPDTVTIGLVGRRVQEWGFLVDGELVPWRRHLRVTPRAGGLS